MKKFLYIAGNDWCIYNFRYQLIKKLRSLGHKVVIVCPRGQYVKEFQNDGIKWIEWNLCRESKNIFRELKSIYSLYNIYKRERPDVIHHDHIKPNLYSSLIVKMGNMFGVLHKNMLSINSFMGIGYIFSSKEKAEFLRKIIVPLLKWSLKNENLTVTFSNKEDRKTFLEYGIIKEDQAKVLISEFVDIDRFAKGKLLNGRSDDQKFKIILAARLLWAKGIKEFVEAAKSIKKIHSDFEFILAGEPDKGAPDYVPVAKLQKWHQDGIVNWLGFRRDIPDLLAQSDVAVLPTFYNEGMPKFLVESATVGLPIITTDIEACRLVVENNKNGFLIDKKDSLELKEKLLHLYKNRNLQKEMAKESRIKAETEFDKRKNIKNWLKLYRIQL